MRDPRDIALLRSFVGNDTDDFDGGEREAFVLPDGTMSTVFLSLNDHAVGEYGGVVKQYTAEGRRSDGAARMFRRHGAAALRALHGELPAAWHELWDVDHADVVAVQGEQPRWPQPPAGQQGFRVFVRNSYRMYDDLHGAQLALLPDAAVAAWGGRLATAGDRAALPDEAFLALARAMVPRGMVDTELAAESIEGRLELVATAAGDELVRGTVEGTFALEPQDLDEVGKRRNAAVLFTSSGRLAGRFTWDRCTRTFRELRVVASDVEFWWKPKKGLDTDFPPRHQIAVEWVRSSEAVDR
jgi:hypothetical protein